ncbi:haloacid dehalogenase-like hydrolase [Cyanobium sp. Morenito 9A2]|nr:haloacid dehalogenase-like hydrolase [Cyanobium sp. Morenito 9A2]
MGRPIAAASPQAAGDPLPSWREGPVKQRLLAFVAAVSTKGSPDYVPVPERLAVFDNDGTLWSEQPMYVQLAFALDRARTLVAQQPELAGNPLIAAAAAGDARAVMAQGTRGVLDLVALTHGGMDTETFARIVRDWFRSACHPSLHRLFTSLTFAPMAELMELLRSRGFRTVIVTGGGTDFLRVVAAELYGVPPEQVIGSTLRTTYAVQGGVPVLLRRPEVAFIDDGPGKPVGIHTALGRRPIAAFGNSDGDFEMLEWTTAGPGARLGLILHHDDSEREFAYDRKSPFGRLDRALAAAPQRGWTVVSMRNDWTRVYPLSANPCPR